MRKLFVVAGMAASLVILLATAVQAGGPWSVKVEGNGIVTGADYDVMETDIGWNFKWNADTGEVKGHLNIVEKLMGGGTRHFQLSGDQVMPVDNPTVRPILFNCSAMNSDSRSVRVEGYDDDGNRIAAHFRDSEHYMYPNTVWYWVQDPAGNYITNTNARLPVSNPFTMECYDGP